MKKGSRYFDHLFQSILKQKENAISQKGRSDLEPPDYTERIEVWYDQIIRETEKNPPMYFVKVLNVFENEEEEIMGIQYSYFAEEDSSFGDTVINIFRK